MMTGNEHLRRQKVRAQNRERLVTLVTDSLQSSLRDIGAYAPLDVLSAQASAIVTALDEASWLRSEPGND